MFFSDTPRHWPWIAAFGAVYLIAALSISNSYYLLIMSNVLVWAVMGLAWNLLSGYSGLISFGHAAFFGLGAYFVVLTQVNLGLTPWLGIPLAGCVGALAGIVVGIPTFRLRGHYFALAMLAYPLALLYVFEWLGYQEAAIRMMRDAPIAFMQFDDGRLYVFIGLALLIGAMALTRAIERSRYGLSLMAIKQDETAAEASGLDTVSLKLRTIALSGGMAGMIGGFYAVVQLVVTPMSAFGVLVSAQALIVAMFGGVGTVWGPIIGAVTLVPLSAWLDAELAADFPGIQGVVYGSAIIAVILAAPEGVFWKLRDTLGKRARTLPHALPAKSGDTEAGDTESGDAESDDAEATDAQWNNAKSTDGESSDDQPGGYFAISNQTAGESLLEVRNLGRAFGGIKAVSDVSFVAKRGEILGIIGPNGAGKTTLFNLINGLTRPDSGEVLLGGKTITSLRPSRICAAGIGRTFQVVKAFDRMTLADNVIVGGYLRAQSLDEARRIARSALLVVGLTDAATKLAGSASNFELRLMELARALASRPQLLLLDEVFAGLTAEETQTLMDRLRELARLGITLVIIEHTMKAMVQLVDRFIVLDHGRVLTSGDPGQVTQDPAVIEAYLGKKWLSNA